MRKRTLIIIALLLTAASSHISYAGWKENYRTKYSKKSIDPNSEKAKKIKRLGNLDVKFLRWRRTPEERKALGLEPKRTLSAHLMAWKEKREEKDKFEGFTSNFEAKRKDLPEETEKVKSGRTLTGTIKALGKAAE